MPFILEYKKNEQILPYTTATALSSGWMWNIPLKTRKGCGYVFDENCISRIDAQKEIENFLGHKIKPIKFIKFDSGRSEVFWKNNVLSLGLSSAFVEPLEATSIHSTIIQLLFFVNEFLMKDKNETILKYSQDSYNTKISKLYDLTLDFISYHYQGGRNDTKFWKNINGKMTPNAKIYYERSKKKIPSVLETNGIFGSPTAGLWNWISAGLKIITPNQSKNELKELNKYEIGEQEFLKHQDRFNNLS
jgi:tryptophan halogenase